MKLFGMIGLITMLLSIGFWIQETSFQPRNGAVTQVALTLPARGYNSVAWVTEQEFAYLHSDTLGFSSSGSEKLSIYHFGTSKERNLLITTQQTCDRLIYALLSRLPDKTLGFLSECHQGMTDVDARLISINPTTGKQSVLYQYPKQFFPSVYSFAPDMKRSLHSQHGGMSNNTTYLASGRGAPQPLISQFPHTMEPRWSPSGAQIAFFAIQGNPEQANSDPRLRGSATLRAGWDLLIAAPDGKAAQVVAQGVRFPDSLAWFPNENKLIFAGEYRGKAGIWLVNLSDKQVTRLWNENDRFALSPNAQHLVLIQQSPSANGQLPTTNQLVLLRLP